MAPSLVLWFFWVTEELQILSHVIELARRRQKLGLSTLLRLHSLLFATIDPPTVLASLDEFATHIPEGSQIRMVPGKLLLTVPAY